VALRSSLPWFSSFALRYKQYLVDVRDALFQFAVGDTLGGRLAERAIINGRAAFCLTLLHRTRQRSLTPPPPRMNLLCAPLHDIIRQLSIPRVW